MYDWIRGGDFAFGLRPKSGVLPQEVTPEEVVVRCVLKKASFDHKAPAPEDEELVVFGVEFRPAVAAVGLIPATAAHWLFTATAAQSESLEDGEYIADAKIMIGAATLQTSSVIVNVRREVTRKRAT